MGRTKMFKSKETEDNLQQKAFAIYKKNQDSFLDSPHLMDGYDTDEDVIKDTKALDTIKYIINHKNIVRDRLRYLAHQLLERADSHDDSKLKDPEIRWLIEMDKEPRYDYGSPEYLDKKKRYEKFFKHHYAHNRHHPEHFTNGVDGMNLADLCEYLIDITSYHSEIHAKQVIQTINSQAERFGLDEQLMQVLKNTMYEYFTYFGSEKSLADLYYASSKASEQELKKALESIKKDSNTN